MASFVRHRSNSQTHPASHLKLPDKVHAPHAPHAHPHAHVHPRRRFFHTVKWVLTLVVLSILILIAIKFIQNQSRESTETTGTFKITPWAIRNEAAASSEKKTTSDTGESTMALKDLNIDKLTRIVDESLGIHPNIDENVDISSVTSHAELEKIYPWLNGDPLEMAYKHGYTLTDEFIKERGYTRLVSVGDIHGDIEQLLAVLILGGVIDEENVLAWKSYNLILIQTGDQFDRGRNSMLILKYLLFLRQHAGAQNNRVQTIIGNHELMNLVGDYRYIHFDEIRALNGGIDEWKRMLSGHHIVGHWLRNLPIAIQIGSSLFVHAGLTLDIGEAFEFNLTKLNRVMTLQLLYADTGGGLTLAGLENGVDGDLDSFLLAGESGPLWTRFFEPDWYPIHRREEFSEYMCERLTSLLDALGAKRMIIGHNVQQSGQINVRCQGKLISADLGLSAYYGGNEGIVEIDLTTDLLSVLSP